MPAQPKTITDWKDCVHGSPDAAAQLYLQRIAALPADTRRRVFAALPSREELLKQFELARNLEDAVLAGVPYLLKDLFDFPGYPTTASSSFLAEVRPQPQRESRLSIDLRAKGAVFAGKTHLNEFAYGLSGENLTFGDCPHPVLPGRLSGGSSSGSAWAVKSGLVPVATGTDTAGSIRVPAAWCGLWGIRFCPNAWASEGCFPLAPAFDTAGWMTATAEDMKTTIRALVQPQASSATAAKGLNLMDAIPNLPAHHRLHYANTLQALDTTRDAAAIEAYRFETKDAPFSYAVLQSRDAYDVHKDWLDAYRERYDPVVWKRLDRARHWSEAQIEKALQAEQATQGFFARAFAQYDYIVLPATQSPAIPSSQHTDTFRNELLAITAPASVDRTPALTVPIPLENGESLGLQILFRDGSSDLPLRVLDALA